MERFKVLSYNIHKGKAFFSRQKTWQLLEELLTLVSPDIVFLQEFLHGPEAEALLEMMADKMWPHHSFGQNATAGDFHYGNAIISKIPFVVTHNTNISNHRLEKRGLLYAKIEPFPNKPLHLFCTHLDLFEKGRKKQLVKIAEKMKELVSENEPILLGGDFNDWNNRLDPIVRKTLNVDEVFLKIIGRPMPTSPSILPVFALDRLYFRGLTAHSAVILNHHQLRVSSDHLPILAEFDTNLGGNP